MCGAFSILHPFKEVGRRFNAGYNDNIAMAPRYNARPTQTLPIVIKQGNENKIAMAQWGMSPEWMKGKLLFNTRDESIITKPFFSRLFKNYRCLIPTDGFYEWHTVGGKKQPYRFTLKTKQLFGLAGIYLEDKESNSLQFSVITTSPNSLVAKYHDRMPVILQMQKEQTYLNRETDPDLLLHELEPLPANLMEAYPVSTLVNSSRNDFPELINPLAH